MFENVASTYRIVTVSEKLYYRGWLFQWEIYC